jgi:uncharacterized lipoprotein YajG
MSSLKEGGLMKDIQVILFLVVMLLVSGCANKKTVANLSPIVAIEKTAALAPDSMKGVFEMTVKSADCLQRMEFLNSELDKLDQRNLIIALRPNAVKELTEKYGTSPEHYFIGKTIQVNGEAKRTKEWVIYKNKNIKKYYYQTKIFVKSADQLTVL